MGNLARWAGKESLLWTEAKGNLAAKPEEMVGILKMRFERGKSTGDLRVGNYGLERNLG